MDAAYLKAAAPEPFTILGKRLRPYCLGHEILFQRFGNRFSLESTEQPGIDDMLIGVFICSQPYHPAISLDNFKIHFGAKVRKWIGGKVAFENALAKFAEYIAANSEIPEFSTEEAEGSGGKPYGTPTIQAVKVSLMANLGLSELEALNTQVSLAFWNHLAWAETQGSLRILDEAERARIAERESKAVEVSERIDDIAKKLFPNGYGNAMKAKEACGS